MNESMVTIYILVSILVMLLLGLTVVWFLNRAQRKITNERIIRAEKEIEFRTELLMNTVKTQENERIRISNELHDDVTSQLSIIHLNVHLLKQKLVDHDSEIAKIIDHIQTSIKSSTERTRTISHELMPSIFRKFGIQHALDDLANGINITEVTHFTINNEHLISFTDFNKQLHLYRIIQELVNNSLKYSEAESLTLTFTESSKNVLEMDYQDNGKGYNQEEINEGLGTSNIKTRVQLLQGEMNLATSLGHGMKVHIKFPNDD